jgi:hypothetical protein
MHAPTERENGGRKNEPEIRGMADKKANLLK